MSGKRLSTRVTDVERAKILGLRAKGLSFDKIVAISGRSKQTVVPICHDLPAGFRASSR